MKSLLIQGGRIIDPGQGLDFAGSVLISDGRITWLGGPGEPSPQSDAVLHAAGMVVCPGFIDLHCHLRQPGFEEKETIATGTRAAARGGFTTVCCMPNTRPAIDGKTVLDLVARVALRDAVVRVLPIACVTRGRLGKELVNMEGLALSGAVAFSDDGSPVVSQVIMRRALELGREISALVIDHCEDTKLTRDGQVNEGAVAVRLGLRGMPAHAENVVVARDLGLARLTGGRVHIAHVSTAGAVELIRLAKEKGVPVTAEATPHHLTLTEESVTGYNTNAKVNPPLRTEEDRRTLVQGLREGVIDIVATDHAPHTEAEKSVEFTQAPFGISGLETALGSLMTLVHRGELSLNLLVAKLTSEPAKVIGLGLGTLSVSAPADVTVFDPAREWVVDTRKFASKGKNTPLAGATLKGKVMATISRGEIVYRDSTVRLQEA